MILYSIPYSVSLVSHINDFEKGSMMAATMTTQTPTPACCKNGGLAEGSLKHLSILLKRRKKNC